MSALSKIQKKIKKEIVGLTPDQLYCIDNTVYNDSARKKLIKLFRIENLKENLRVCQLGIEKAI